MSDRQVGLDDHYRSMYPPSEYLAADELPLGRDIVVVIKSVSIGDMQIEGSSKKEQKPVLEFEGKEKRWPLPKTVAKMIARLYGEKPKRDWPGKAITLYRTTAKLKGETVPAIRIRPTAPPLPKKTAAGAAVAESNTDEQSDYATGDGPPPDDVDLGRGAEP